MEDKFKMPIQFKAHYEGPCGESYEIYGMAVDELALPCELCERKHKFKKIYIEYRW